MMNNIYGLNKLHPGEHAGLFFKLMDKKRNASTEEEDDLYDFYMGHLIERCDSILDVTDQVMTMFNESRETSKRLYKEERKERLHEKVNGRDFDGLRTSMGTRWAITKRRSSKAYIKAQREKYADVINKHSDE